MTAEKVGQYPTHKSVWILIILLDAMTFLVIATGTFLGTFLGNVGVFWVIGTLAKRQEQKQREELQKLQQGYLEMAQRENERLQRYAKMEG